MTFFVQPQKEDALPVHRQKKDTKPDTPGSTQEQTAPALPEQQVFHQHLRELVRSAIRVVLEGVKREDLDALIGVGLGESSPNLKGDRNGYYTRAVKYPNLMLRHLQSKLPLSRRRQFLELDLTDNVYSERLRFRIDFIQILIHSVYYNF